MNLIGEVNYQNPNELKCEVREETERNVNSLFTRNILTQDECQTLLAKFFSGAVSFGSDGLTAEEAANFTKDDYNEIINTVTEKQGETKLTTAYIIQPGDTPEKIAEKLGFEGDEAILFATKIQAKAINSGMYYSYGFRVGDMITLEGDFSEKIEQLKNAGEYNETTDDVNNRYRQVDREKRAKAREQRKQQPKTDNDGGTNPVKKKEAPKDGTEPVKKKEAPQEGTSAQQQRANNIRSQVDNIIKNFGTAAQWGSKALDSITPENVAFVLKQYSGVKARKLALDIINNAGKNGQANAIKAIKEKICKPLVLRAQKLGINVYHRGWYNIKDTTELVAYIDKMQKIVLDAEYKNNPALKTAFDKTKQREVQRQRSTKDIERDAQALANELFKEIDGIGSDANVTKSLLKKITPENVAFVVNGYLNAKATVTTMRVKQHKENSSHRTLAKDLIDESGINMDDVKNSICKPLVAQAKRMGLVGIYHSSYMNINDIDTLDTWITNTAKKVREAMTNSVNTSQESVGRNEKSVDKANSPIYKEAGVVSISQKYDKDGNVIESTYTYKDGKVVREYQDAKRGRVRELVKSGNTAKPKTQKIYEPIPMKIELPADARAEEKAFAKALEKNKARLMKMLGIDSDTYNKLARLALAIAKHETDFGYGGEYSQYKYELGRCAPDTQLHDWSYGPTQIKFEMQKKDAWIADKFAKLGLKEGADLYDMENSALATMVVLAQNNRIIQNNKKYQNGMEAARGSVVTANGWEIKDGHAQKTGHTKSWVNTVTDEDVLYYFWNGQAVQIIDGTMEPETNERVRDVRIKLERYSIKEDDKAKQEASKRVQDKKTVDNFTPNSNNGAIGSVVFMPKMYKKDLSNKENELKILEKALDRNGITEESKKALLKSVKNGEIAFEYGLTEAEANALTQKDVDLLLKHIGKLKQTLEASGIKFSDGISSEEALKMRNQYQDTIRSAEERFNADYLNAHTKVVDINNVDKSNVVMATNNNRYDASSMHRKDGERRGFIGFGHRKLDVNPANTSKASYALARAAEKEATKRGTAGHCLDGVRATFDAIGINTRGDDMEYTPKRMGEYFAKHPDMFEEVKYVNIGNGKAKQITYADLPKLPAGYIVIFIPDPNSKEFSGEPGHIAITNGNGQGYADEGDNLNWGDYSEATQKDGTNKSGKGEHGTFRVFRLTDKWEVDPATGKLVFKG